MYAGRDDLAKTTKKRYQDVRTDAGTYCIQSLSDRERSQVEAFLVDEDGNVNTDRRQLMKARWLVASLVDGDEKSSRLYTDDEVELVANFDSKVTNQIVDAVFDLNGLTSGDIEELEKNYLPTDSDDSSPTG